MPPKIQNIAIFGSTGSIGKSTLEVVDAYPDSFNVTCLTANRSIDLLCEQAHKYKPRWVVCSDANCGIDKSSFPQETEILVGAEGLDRVAATPEVDTLVAAIVGSAGLHSTYVAIEAGKRIALANKETMVVAGSLAMKKAAESGAEIFPVDSEHSAIFQANLAGRKQEVSRTILTASGGPFRTWDIANLQTVTVEQALNHPTWQMGKKITIDSATMMNKTLEVIEAKWLFDLNPERIEVVIHPQSIVHSMVEFVDGSTIAQLSPPDMKLPIQYALTFPERYPGPARTINLADAFQLNFEPPDLEKFPAIELGMEVAQKGGTSGAVLNAANEAAVEAFLNKKIKFTEIVPACRTILENHDFDPNPSLEQLLKVDRWSREEFKKWTLV